MTDSSKKRKGETGDDTLTKRRQRCIAKRFMGNAGCAACRSRHAASRCFTYGTLADLRGAVLC